MRDYRLISADSHITEPPGVWVDRMPQRFKERAPHMVSLEKGDAWIFEGYPEPINFGLNQCGGLPPERRVAWIRWEEARVAGYDPAVRLADMDQDEVDADILYPTPRPSIAMVVLQADPELHLAQIQAYNNWLSEFCSHDLERLGGLAVIPNIGVEAAVLEMRRAIKLPGIRGVLLGQLPHGGRDISPKSDPFWAEAQDAAVPVAVHISLSTGGPRRQTQGLQTAEFRFFEIPVLNADFIYTGVFDRFPDLMMVMAEGDCAWIPYVKEQMDDRFHRVHPDTRPSIKLRPSEYYDRNIFSVYITDHFGIQLRKDVGVDQMMWSSDFPHTGTHWPNSWKVIEKDFAGVAEEEKHKILAGNAARLYKFGDND